MIAAQPGQQYIDAAVRRSPLLYAAGQIAAAYFGGPQGAALYAAYHAYQGSGSVSAVVPAGANAAHIGRGQWFQVNPNDKAQ